LEIWKNQILFKKDLYNKMLLCQYCLKVYPNKSSFNYHQKNTKSCLALQEKLKKEVVSSHVVDSIFKCHYCEKDFSNQSNLKQHQKINKTCLLKRSEIENLSFICNGCQKSFTTKISLDKHTACCCYLKDKEIQELEKRLFTEKHDLEERLLKEKQENKDLILQLTRTQTKLKVIEEQFDRQQKLNDHLQNKLLEKATTKTNNTTNIDLKLFLSKESIEDKINKTFSNKYIGDYIDIARFIKDNIAMDDKKKLMYKCVDVGREIFMFQDEKGNEVKDVKASKLLELTTHGLREKTAKIHAKEIDEYNYLYNISKEDEEDFSEDAKKRMNAHKHNADKAQDLIVNKLYNENFPSKVSKELTKVLS
jgi:stress-induced morphogen